MNRVAVSRPQREYISLPFQDFRQHSLIQIRVCIEQGNERRIISYASCSLNDVERRYSQTEKEALALVWSWSKVWWLPMDTQAEKTCRECLGVN